MHLHLRFTLAWILFIVFKRLNATASNFQPCAWGIIRSNCVTRMTYSTTTLFRNSSNVFVSKEVEYWRSTVLDTGSGILSSAANLTTLLWRKWNLTLPASQNSRRFAADSKRALDLEWSDFLRVDDWKDESLILCNTRKNDWFVKGALTGNMIEWKIFKRNCRWFEW